MPKYVKVVGALLITKVKWGRLEQVTSRGICVLPENQTVQQFAEEFMFNRGVKLYQLHQRGTDTLASNPLMSFNTEQQSVITYTFTEFPSEDLSYHAKMLSQAELQRDLPQLQPLL